MPLPAFPTLTNAVALTKIRAAQYNDLVSALTALKFWTAKGDLPVGYDADQLDVLVKPSVTSLLQMDNAGNPSWVAKDSLPGFLHKKNIVSFNPAGQTFSGTWADITGATFNLTLTYTCTVVVYAAVVGYNATTGRVFWVRAMVDGVADTATDPFNGGQARNEALPYIHYATGVPAGTRTVKLQCQADTDPNFVERGRLMALAYVE